MEIVFSVITQTDLYGFFFPAQFLLGLRIIQNRHSVLKTSLSIVLEEALFRA